LYINLLRLIFVRVSFFRLHTELCSHPSESGVVKVHTPYAEGLEFKSRADQILHNVANGSPPLHPTQVAVCLGAK